VRYNKLKRYDIKFRRRAIEYWNEGHSQIATAEVFSVSPRTLQAWKNQPRETGKLEPKKRRETWKEVDPDRLIKYLEEHPDAYLREIAEEFICSEVAIFKALKRLKISRKKNYCLQGN
jgi:transposase